MEAILAVAPPLEPERLPGKFDVASLAIEPIDRWALEAAANLQAPLLLGARELLVNRFCVRSLLAAILAAAAPVGGMAATPKRAAAEISITYAKSRSTDFPYYLFYPNGVKLPQVALDRPTESFDTMAAFHPLRTFAPPFILIPC